MSAYAMTNDDCGNRSGGGFLRTLILLAVAAFVIYFAATAAQVYYRLSNLAFGDVQVEVAYQEHANGHTEADDIRCSDNVLAVFTNKSCERFNVLKQLEDGRVGDHVLQPCKRYGLKTVLEITAYVIGGGSLDEAIAVLTAKGCTQVWP